MSPETALRLAGGAVLILANAFFVTTEFALTRVRQFNESEFRSSPGLRRAWEMTERLEFYLTGCQVGITFSSVLLGIVAEPALTHLLEPVVTGLGVRAAATPWISVAAAILLINLAHTVYGEQVPTYLGVERPKQVARLLAPGLYLWTKTMWPFILVGDWIAKHSLRAFGVEMTRSWTKPGEITSYRELRRQMGELLSRGRLPEDRQEEILNALQIGQTPVREIMVPRSEMRVLRQEASPEENFRVIARHQKNRFPLMDGSGDIIGVVYVPSIFARREELETGGTTFGELASDPLLVEPEMPVSLVIDRMQERHEEVAFVAEGSRVEGLVTITDAFEEIAGDVEDPLD